MSTGTNSALGPVLQMGSSEGSGAFFLVFLLIILVFLALWVYGCIWIYRDAERRGASSAIWTIAMVAGGFTFGLLAVGAVALAWVLTRPPIDEGDDNDDVGGGSPDNNGGTDDSDAASSWDVDNHDDNDNSGQDSGSWDDVDGDNSSDSEYDVWDSE